jgi:hypothetical protein
MIKEEEIQKAITTDEYAGQGGSYVYDSKTGKRMPIDEKKEVVAEVLSKE